jgi:ABC-type uncharacterized transport system permease subunit
VLVLTAAANLEQPWTVLDCLAIVLLLGLGVEVRYSAVVLLALAGFWLVSREVLFDLWFAVVEMVHVPSDLFAGNSPLLSLRVALFYGMPLFVAVNVPARFGARLLADPWPIRLQALMAVAWLVLSHGVFQRALASYRSASS